MAFAKKIDLASPISTGVYYLRPRLGGAVADYPKFSNAPSSAYFIIGSFKTYCVKLEFRYQYKTNNLNPQVYPKPGHWRKDTGTIFRKFEVDKKLHHLTEIQ